MQGLTKPDIAAQIAGALEWWQDAGVDSDFTDDPRDWLVKEATPEPEPAIPVFAPVAEKPAAPLVLVGGPPADWPQDLAAFQAWWLTEPLLDHGDVARRVSPRGPVGAELMVLVADPEENDGDVLLSGPQGKLLAGILAALGLSPDQVYIASVLTRPTPLPDWNQLAAEGLGGLTLHHVELAAPKRLLSFGNTISSLVGHDPANKPEILLGVDHERRIIPLMAAMDLAALLARPRAKAGLWQRLLDWMGPTDT